MGLAYFVCGFTQGFNLITAFLLGDVLRLPIFIDTLGTVVVVFYAGPVSGMAVK